MEPNSLSAGTTREAVFAAQSMTAHVQAMEALLFTDTPGIVDVAGARTVLAAAAHPFAEFVKKEQSLLQILAMEKKNNKKKAENMMAVSCQLCDGSHISALICGWFRRQPLHCNSGKQVR